MREGWARGGAGGTPGAARGGGVSKSATKAPRGGIGRGWKRGIPTILLRRSDAIRAFVADLDNLRHHGSREGRTGPDGLRTAGRRARCPRRRSRRARIVLPRVLTARILFCRLLCVTNQGCVPGALVDVLSLMRGGETRFAGVPSGSPAVEYRVGRGTTNREGLSCILKSSGGCSSE